MAASATFTVEVMVLTEFAEHGLWCERCALPSVTQVPYRIVMPRSLTTVGSGSVLVCQDCGEYRRAS